jgi:nitric oxide reductase
LTDLSWQLIKAHEGIIASNQSANRDEEIFEDPDTFNMHRKWPKEDPLGFGFGDHRCIAEHLAKAELTSVFSKPNPTRRRALSVKSVMVADRCEPLAHLYSKLPNLKLATSINDIQYSPLDRDVGIEKLLVTF